MIVNLCFLVFILNFPLSHLYKINNVMCNQLGLDGYCRPREDCVGYKKTLSQSDCPENYVCCPRRAISKIKCNEYAEAVYIHKKSNFHSTTDTDRIDECGILPVPLIIGGEKALPKEFPHMAAIGIGESPDQAEWVCGGSLISELYILTAAHCLQSRGKRPKFVKLGVTNVKNGSDPHVMIRTVVKHIYHPKYQLHSSLNDIGLLKMDKPIKFTPYIRPACLDYSNKITEQNAIAIGWGRTESHKGSPDLMKVRLDFIDKPTCSKAYKRDHRVEKGLMDSQLCAGYMRGGKDTCQGDSGGPLQTIKQKPYCMYKIIGLTSFGMQACGHKYSPAIYTRIFSYIPWIETIVWPANR